MNINADRKNCEHKIWLRAGQWDGKNIKTGELIGGPLLECVECGLEKNFTYQELKDLTTAGKIKNSRATTRPSWSKPIDPLK